ncbi:hypothetical protein [Roseitranquillus sediminis]|uniref:hypothetical protein n=1 Tax=Roseitranquillus sediminis TaxID=2809051 RepID=UPI001D0C3A0F|nr:hypothetical protein [Roseitranquillus sediminis]MBM9594981.1 hypothetical protein [Roseitranquillus sediminis]
MFLETSRYAKVPRDEVEVAGRRTVAIRLRRLPAPPADPHVVQQGDRLDLIAQARFDDGTRFWHIADANSARDSRTLVTRVLRTIMVPRS